MGDGPGRAWTAGAGRRAWPELPPQGGNWGGAGGAGRGRLTRWRGRLGRPPGWRKDSESRHLLRGRRRQWPMPPVADQPKAAGANLASLASGLAGGFAVVASRHVSAKPCGGYTGTGADPVTLFVRSCLREIGGPRPCPLKEPGGAHTPPKSPIWPSPPSNRLFSPFPEIKTGMNYAVSLPPVVTVLPTP